MIIEMTAAEQAALKGLDYHWDSLTTTDGLRVIFAILGPKRFADYLAASRAKEKAMVRIVPAPAWSIPA